MREGAAAVDVAVEVGIWASVEVERVAAVVVQEEAVGPEVSRAHKRLSWEGSRCRPQIPA